MTGLRIGSLFSGYGGLDMGVQAVVSGDVVWHCQYDPDDHHQYAARILAHHWPHVPNLGDITAVTWERVLDQYGPIDVLTGGFPCQDVSAAGQRAGLADGTRSGLWSHMAHAISVLRPRTVVIENVEGLLSTRASSDVEPCPHCVGDTDAEPPLRALGAVLGDLARLGFDAEWARVAASEVGAAHQRRRVFVLAWPADTGGEGLARRRTEGQLPTAISLLPTPSTSESTGAGHTAQGGMNLRHAVYLLLPTPRASERENRQTRRTPSQEAGTHGKCLAAEVCELLLPTPRASDTGTPGRRASEGFRPPLSEVVLPLLPTPTAADGERNSPTYSRGNPTLTGATTRPPSAAGKPSPDAPPPGQPTLWDD